jgi:hypothetical protein
LRLAVAPVPPAGGSWALEGTCTNPCAGTIFPDTIGIVQKPGSSSFTGVNSVGETIEGTQSGLSAHFTETLNGYPDELATFQVAVSKDGSTFTGSYDDENGSGGTTKGTRQVVEPSTSVAVSLASLKARDLQIGKTLDVPVTVTTGKVDLT